MRDEEDILRRFEKCIRQGDWDGASGLTRFIAGEKLPADPEALAERRQRLQGALIAARVARAGLAVSLARVRAAAIFTQSPAPPSRQKFDGPADY